MVNLYQHHQGHDELTALLGKFDTWLEAMQAAETYSHPTKYTEQTAEEYNSTAARLERHRTANDAEVSQDALPELFRR